MPTTAAPQKTSNAGIADTNDGRRIIPASTRADGSLRKELRVRPGYRPPEDVELYRNRNVAGFKERGKSAGVPGAAPVEAKPEVAVLSKNAKKRAAKKRNKEEEGGQELEDWEEIPAPINKDDKNENNENNDNNDNNDNKEATTTTTTTTNTTTTTTATTTPVVHKENDDLTQEEKDKQVRNLKKKIRQGMDLKEKRARGEPLIPDQLAKLVGLNELINQLKKLGVDYGDGTEGGTKKEGEVTEGGAEK